MHSESTSRTDNSIFASLPLELVAQIFTTYRFEGLRPECFPAVKRAWWDDPLQEQSLYRLSAVCKTWYAIVLSTPRLWTTLSLTLVAFVKDPLFHRSMISAYLERSGSLPLSLAVWLRKPRYAASGRRMMTPAPTPPVDTVKLLTSVLGAHANRWKNLFLEVPPSLVFLFTGSSDAGANGPSLLHDIHIRSPIAMTQYKDVGRSQFRLNSHGGPPAPVRVAANLDFQNIHIDYENVTYLILNKLSPPEFITVLRSAVGLEVICVGEFVGGQVHHADGLKTPTGMTTHTCLKKFHASPSPALFENLTLPKLSVLDVRRRDYTYPVDTLVKFLTRSSSTIREVYLSDSQEGVDEIRSCVPGSVSVKQGWGS